MLTITVLGEEHFNESTSEIFTVGDVVLELEHSLVSLSKWESKYEKPFLETKDKSGEEVLDYIKAMMLTPDVPEEVLSRLSEDNIKEISAYIDAKMTATWFNEIVPEPKRNSEVMTAEVVYYWMTVFNIPFECETWHLNRLFTLIKVCNIRQSKPKKMTRSQIAEHNRALNERRRKQLGTKG